MTAGETRTPLCSAVQDAKSELSLAERTGLGRGVLDLARRVSSDLSRPQAGTLFVTRAAEVPYVLALAPRPVHRVGSPEEAAAVLADRAFDVVVVGTDIETWPTPDVIARTAGRIPCLHFMKEAPKDPDGGRDLNAPALCTGPGGSICVPLDIVLAWAYPVPDLIPSLFDRCRVLRELFKSDEWIRRCSDPSHDGARPLCPRAVVISEHGIPSPYCSCLECNALVGKVDDVDSCLDALSHMRSHPEPDFLLVHTCCISRPWEIERAVELLATASEHRIPCVLLDCCLTTELLEAARTVSSVVSLMACVTRAIPIAARGAVLDRLAWLHYEGRPTSHLRLDVPLWNASGRGRP